MQEKFKKILIAGTGRYPSTLKHLLVLVSMMNFAFHTSASGQQGGVTMLCRSLLIAVIGTETDAPLPNKILVSQVPKGLAGVQSPCLGTQTPLALYGGGQVTQEKSWRRERMQGGNLGLWKSGYTSVFPASFPGCPSTLLLHCGTKEWCELHPARRRAFHSLPL